MSPLNENNKSKIVALGDRMRERQDPRNWTVLAYHRSRTRPNLLRILATVPDVEGLGPVRERIEQCQARKRCQFYGCPNCGRRLRRKAVQKALKQIVAKAGAMPDPRTTSFVTIRAGRVDQIPSSAISAMNRLKQRIKELHQTRLLRQTAWIGWFDVSLMGVVHFHSIVLHQGISKSALMQKLKSHFRASKAVKVSPWERHRTDLQNLQSVLEYSLPADRHSKLCRERLRYGNRTAQYIARRIVCLAEMTKRGVRGLRLEMNMSSSRIWKAGVMFDLERHQTVVVPEMEELILRFRNQAKRIQTEWLRRRIGESERGEMRQEEGVRVFGTDAGLERLAHEEEELMDR
jgi:hypothetical protein